MFDKEEELFRKRMIELSKISYQRNICTYTDFLNLNELNLLNNIGTNELYTPFNSYGGYKLSQRQMIEFIPDAVSCRKTQPIVALKIRPKSRKYSEVLSHRDFLGSLLGLGLERSKVGDFLIYKDYALVFVHEKIADFICLELNQVKHTPVTCDFYYGDFENYEPEFELIHGSISSMRLDALMALVIKESRSKLIRHIEQGKVFVNAKLITTNAYKINPLDIISIRGIGKFQFIEVLTETKKGKLYVELKKYI